MVEDGSGWWQKKLDPVYMAAAGLIWCGGNRNTNDDGVVGWKKKMTMVKDLQRGSNDGE